MMLLLNLGTAQQKQTGLFIGKDNTLLENILKKNVVISNLLAEKDSLNIQIIYTKIDRNEKNEPHFTDYTYNVQSKKYFYPASTVKMPVAFLALEKLQSLKAKGVDKFTSMVTDSSNDKQTIVYTQPTAENSAPTIANYIKQIFLVSDNDAFNRLYEFLGQEYIQQQLQRKGYKDAAIRHRLQIALTPEQNSITNPIRFYDTSGNLIFEQKEQISKSIFPSFKASVGKGYYRNGKIISEPFDFSLKNRMYLEYQHNILRSVLFPQSFSSKKRFKLTKEDELFLLHCMSAYPSESHYPSYDTTYYYDTYCKFLFYGAEKKQPLPNVRIFNKVGDAYGYLTDIAYIIDIENKVEFMLSATILCNRDGIFNDDQYDYNTFGFPFMKALGQTIYDYELKRERKFKPDLSRFILDYSNSSF